MIHYSVLVVEDDPILRMNAATLFEEAGFDVTDFATADAAAEFIRHHSPDIDALFTDVSTPGDLDGWQLASMVDTSWPGITILVTSGDLGTRPSELPSRVGFISKPWLPLQLLVTLQQAAESHGAKMLL